MNKSVSWIGDGFGQTFMVDMAAVRRSARLQADVADSPHMPQLAKNLPTHSVHGLGHFFPTVHLLRSVNTGGGKITMPSGRDRSGLGENHHRTIFGVSPLGVVLRMEFSRKIARLGSPRTGQRSHPDRPGIFMDCRFEQDSFPSRLPDYLKMALNGLNGPTRPLCKILIQNKPQPLLISNHQNPLMQ